MDPITAYYLIINLEKEKKNNINKKSLHIPMKDKTKNKNIIQINCNRCGQFSYWCQCFKEK